MEDEVAAGDDEGAGPRTWELDDGAARPVRRARTGRWEKTLHGTCQQWRRLPSTLPDERRTPFAAQSALERVCGLAPLRGTRWPQETAAVFVRREPQYAGYLPVTTDAPTDAPADAPPSHTIGETEPLPRSIAEAAGCADSAEDESDGTTGSSEGGGAAVYRVPVRACVRAVDAGAVRVAGLPRGARAAAEPEVLGCARHILATEGVRVRDVGRAAVHAACVAVQDMLDAVHDRLLDRAIALRSGATTEDVRDGEGEGEGGEGEDDDGNEEEEEEEDAPELPLSAGDVLDAAADVLFARPEVAFPATVLEEARAAAAHVESVLESLQTADIVASLRELRDEPCFQPTTTTTTTTTTTGSSGTSTSGSVEERRMTRKGALRARGRLLRDMPARLRPWVRSHAWYARLRADENTPAVWALVREWQSMDLALEERVHTGRHASTPDADEQPAKRPRADASADEGGVPDDDGDDVVPGASCDSDGSTTDESPPHTPFPTMMT